MVAGSCSCARAVWCVRPGQADLLRGLSVRQLDLASMVLGPVVELPGDVRQITLWPTGRDGVEVEVVGLVGASSKFHFDGQRLEPAQTIHRRFSASVHPVVLTAAGVAAHQPRGHR